MGLSDWLFQSEEEDDDATDWPSATGEVHSAEVHVRSRDVYTAEISYFYSARGEYYSGYLQHLFFSEDEAYDFLAHFPKGRKIVVHYCPDKPEVSVLFEQSI